MNEQMNERMKEKLTSLLNFSFSSLVRPSGLLTESLYLVDLSARVMSKPQDLKMEQAFDDHGVLKLMRGPTSMRQSPTSASIYRKEKKE